MAFVKLEDFDGTMDLTFFPKTWGTLRSQIEVDKVYAFKGKLDAPENRPDASLIVDSLEDINALQVRSIHELHIQMESNFKNEIEIQKLRDFLFGTQGNCSVYFHIETGNGSFTVKANTQMTAPSDEEFIDSLRNIPYVKDVWTA